MNVANLQLEGLLMAIAAVNHLLVQNGVVTIEEMESALKAAEASENRSDELPPSHREAIAFPIRLLQLANRCQPETELPAFSALTKMVGQMK